MILSDYFSLDNNDVSFSEQQASAFAKGVAGDFNPIHDPGSRRFCVPGDLLFCVLLYRYGVAESTAVQFAGMLDGKTRMRLPVSIAEHTPISDADGKSLLSLFFEGERFSNAAFVNSLSEQYVKFSGKTFPDILVPLMREADVMINPDRPLVIYKDMSLEIHKDAVAGLHTFESDQHVELTVINTDISVNGRKGAVRLQFAIGAQGKPIGVGEKNMVLSGLREYDDNEMQQIVDKYNLWRANYR